MKAAIAALLIATAITTAAAQQPGPADYVLKLSAADVDTVGAGLQELPAKTANPVIQRIVDQVRFQQAEHLKALEDKKPKLDAEPK